MALTHALSDLAAHPEHVGALRDEARAALAEGAGGSNFTKDVVAKLARLDSFMRESQRLSPPITGLTTFHRMCLRDATLSDGTFLPSGTTIVVNASQRYGDPDLLDHPDQFDGFRFYRSRERATQVADKAASQFATSSADNLLWGQGRHACPGRFFAMNEIKVLLAKVVLGYDAALEDGGKRPENLGFATQVMPNPTARVMVTKRKAEP